MDHVGVVVDDLAAATAFFVALGLEVSGEATVGGPWVDGVIGLDGVRSRIAMLSAPGGGTAVELSEFETPTYDGPAVPGAANVPGLRHVAFLVDDLDAVLDRLRVLGVAPLDAVQQYEDVYRLCYVRGPAGMLVELAEEVG